MIGNRYYETAAQDGYINYEETVQYPFGYGLSYTTFEQKMGELLQMEILSVLMLLLQIQEKFLEKRLFNYTILHHIQRVGLKNHMLFWQHLTKQMC